METIINNNNTQNALSTFFDKYSEPQYTDKLWSFYRAHVLYTESINRTNATTDLTFYEDLLNALRTSSQLQYKTHADLQIQACMVEETMVSLEGVVELIKKAIPVGAIYNLSPTADELDLLIVLEKSCTKAYQEFESILDLTKLGFKKGMCTVHSYGLLHSLMSRGHVFYNTACVEHNIIYKKNNEELLVPLSRTLFEKTKSESEILFKGGIDKAVHFYNGVQLYINNEVYDMAMFMLQQACELTYRSLLNVLRGKDVKCHSLVVLRKHVKRYAPEVLGVFSAVEEEEIKYLQLLEEAYVKSRYYYDYTIDPSLISHLNKSIGLLQQKAINLFKHKMDVLTQKIEALGIN